MNREGSENMGLAYRKRSPSRCDYCGCMMVMVRLPNRTPEGSSLSAMVGGECLVCDRVLDLEAMLHRQERHGMGFFRDARPRTAQEEHA